MISVLIVLVAATAYALTQVKPWSVALIKVQVKKALQAKTVTIKDLDIHIKGPIVISGLVIKKNGALDINIPRIALDKGLWALVDGSTGTVTIASLLVAQLKLSDVHLSFWWKGTDLILHILEGKVLSGSFKGEVVLQLLKEPSYRVNIDLVKISLPKVIHDFKLQQKLSLTGKLSGNVQVTGRGKSFTVIQGELASVDEGGELIINDTQFIKDMVKRMRLNKVTGSEELFVASLKHYLYNTATVKLRLDKKDLELDTVLDGDAGKRSFPIRYHDFSLERLGL